MNELLLLSIPYVIGLLAWGLHVETKLAKIQNDISWIIKILNNPGHDKPDSPEPVEIQKQKTFFRRLYDAGVNALLFIRRCYSKIRGYG